MNFVISRQVPEFNFDTFQSASENSALPTKRLFLTSSFNSLKVSSALSAPLLTLATLGSENRRITQKESCVLLAFGTPRKALSQRK